MSATPYTPPSLNGAAFHCPICGTYAQQRWAKLFAIGGATTAVDDWVGACCAACRRWSLWKTDVMYFPLGGTAPLANPDLPTDAKKDYDEAREIAGRSPRGAAALLRLVIQKVCMSLGEDGSDLNTAIKNLTKKGLPETVQRALDVVRVIGNNAVHPGQIDLDDNPQIAASLFGLVNFIAEKTISDPKKVDELYGTLPRSSVDAIDKRDGRK